MTSFMQVRDQIRRFIASHEIAMQRVWHFVLTLVSLICLSTAFPVEGVVQSPLLIILFAAVGTFLPLSGCALLIVIYGMLHLATMSLTPAIIAGLFFGFGYLVCVYYQAGAKYHLILVPVTYELGIPFVCSMISGLVGRMNDVAGIVAGGVIAFYLKVLHENSALILEGSSSTAISLLTSQMIQNRMFYFYIVSLVVMFLVVYLIRIQNIRYAWIFAVLFGVATEFVIMLAGYLFTGGRENVPGLIVGNLVLLLIGVGMTYLLMDLDYSRVEKVQYEDDDYYYYVTAVPKIHFAKEEKTVKKITRDRRGRK